MPITALHRPSLTGGQYIISEFNSFRGGHLKNIKVQEVNCIALAATIQGLKIGGEFNLDTSCRDSDDV